MSSSASQTIINIYVTGSWVSKLRRHFLKEQEHMSRARLLSLGFTQSLEKLLICARLGVWFISCYIPNIAFSAHMLEWYGDTSSVSKSSNWICFKLDYLSSLTLRSLPPTPHDSEGWTCRYSRLPDADHVWRELKEYDMVKTPLSLCFRSSYLIAKVSTHVNLRFKKIMFIMKHSGWSSKPPAFRLFANSKGGL